MRKGKSHNSFNACHFCKPYEIKFRIDVCNLEFYQAKIVKFHFELIKLSVKYLFTIFWREILVNKYFEIVYKSHFRVKSLAMLMEKQCQFSELKVGIKNLDFFMKFPLFKSFWKECQKQCVTQSILIDIFEVHEIFGHEFLIKIKINEMLLTPSISLIFTGSVEPSNLMKMRNSNLGQSAPSLTASLVGHDFIFLHELIS